MSPRERSSSAPFSGCPVVVIVEDDYEMRRVLRSRLVKAGYRVLEAREGREALECVRGERGLGPGWAPAALVSDVRMPGMNGLELLARVRTLDPLLPVILITAFGDPDTHAEAKRLGAAASLDKPLVLNQLLEALRRVAPVGAPASQESRPRSGPETSRAASTPGLVSSKDMCRYHPFPWQRISLPDDESIVEYIPHQDPVAIRWPACRDVFLSLSLEPEYAVRRWAGLNDEGTFDEGSIAIIAAGQEVRWDRPRGGSAAVHVFLSERSIRHAALEPDDARPMEIISATDARDSQLEFAVRRLHMELARKGGGSKLHRDVLLRCIASRLGRTHAVWPPPQSLPRRRLTAFDVARVHDHVRVSPAKDVGIDTLAALIRRSPYDFMRLFKLTTGHTVHRYVTRLRIEVAREKLRNRRAGELSLADLSAELGFADQSHFTRCFRRATGSTPGRYLVGAGRMPATSTGDGGASAMGPTT